MSGGSAADLGNLRVAAKIPQGGKRQAAR